MPSNTQMKSFLYLLDDYLYDSCNIISCFSSSIYSLLYNSLPKCISLSSSLVALPNIITNKNSFNFLLLYPNIDIHLEKHVFAFHTALVLEKSKVWVNQWGISDGWECEQSLFQCQRWAHMLGACISHLSALIAVVFRFAAAAFVEFWQLAKDRAAY